MEPSEFCAGWNDSGLLVPSATVLRSKTVLIFSIDNTRYVTEGITIFPFQDIESSLLVKVIDVK